MIFMSNISEKPEDREPHIVANSSGHIPMNRDSFYATKHDGGSDRHWCAHKGRAPYPHLFHVAALPMNCRS